MSLALQNRRMSSDALSSYYQHHMAFNAGTACDWTGQGPPMPLRGGIVQVGVTRDRYLLLLTCGELRGLSHDGTESAVGSHIASFHAGETGWFAIDY